MTLQEKLTNSTIKRRLASGEITNEEYQKLKQLIDK
jgi:uncharacterized membrane protein